MKKILLSLLLIVCSTITWAEDIDALKLHLASGKQVVCLLEERPVVTFTNEEVVITTHMHEVRYLSNDVLKFTYVNFEEDGIHSPQLDQELIRLDGNNLSIYGIASDSPVSVYTADGVLVASVKADKSGTVSVVLPEQSGKVYVVKTSVANFKISKP